MLAYKKRKDFMKNCSFARKRWIWAIRRVLTQLLVKKLTKRISSMKFKKFDRFPAAQPGKLAPIKGSPMQLQMNKISESAEDPTSAIASPAGSRHASPRGGITSGTGAGMLNSSLSNPGTPPILPALKKKG